jgi:ligand-binding sensor domain-containing protein
MKLHIALFLLVFFHSACLAQEGDYFLTHHKYDDDRYDPVNFDVAQDSNGLIYIANKGGILRYDGHNWDLVSCNGSVYDVHITPQNRVYVAGKTGFGYLQNVTGLSNASYIPIFSKAPVEGIVRIEQRADSILFLSNKTLYIYQESKNTTSQVQAPEDNDFTNIFILSGKVLLQTQNKNIYTLQNGRLKEAVTACPRNAWILFAADHPSNKSISLIGTDRNELYWIRQGKASRIYPKDDGYIEQSELTACSWVSNNLIAIGTLRGGVVFLNATTGMIDKIVNYHTGLPDNEVYALGSDRDKGVWVAHEYGFTRIAPELPFRCFSNFPGIEGNLLAVMPFENTVYAGTSTGMYYLEETKNFQTTLQRVEVKGSPRQNRKERTENKLSVKTEAQPVKTITEEANTKTKRKAFSFLKSKKKKAREEEVKEEESRPEVEEKTVEPAKRKSTFIQRIFSRKPKTIFERHRQLKSVRYIYKAVAGFTGKSSSIRHLKNSLLSGGTGGLFEIKEKKAVRIDDDNTLVFSYDATLNEIFSFTGDHILKVFSQEKDKWSMSSSIKIEDDIVHINRTSQQDIWLAGRNAIYLLQRNIAGQLQVVRTLGISNPFNDDVYSFVHNDKTYFITSHDCFYYDASRKVLLHDREFKKQFGKAERVIMSNESIWIFNGTRWICLTDKDTQHRALNVLGFFKQVKSLYAQQGGECWVTTSTNELYKVSSAGYNESSMMHKVLLREVRSKEGQPLPLEDLHVEQDNSSLAFEFVHPDYLGLIGVQYQYKLNGLSDEWTAWTPNSSLSYQLLPAGSYNLHVRIRDTLGKVSEEQVIHFNVVPPYWKTSWFYLLEIIFFGSLLWATFRLNRKESRYEFITRILTLLTLVLIIELIQNLVESYWATNTSPVINFFVQAAIALLVYPVEKILRQFLSGKPS